MEIFFTLLFAIFFGLPVIFIAAILYIYLRN
jgi:hypothetical protein